MRREELYNVSKSRKNSVGTKGIYVSVVILILILASLSGATYAWFAHQASAGDTTFVAGTVKLTTPINVEDILIQPGSSVKHAFVPNSGEASVSKVDLVTREEIARYYTAPRVDDLLGFDGSTSEWVYNRVEPYDWRTSRIAQDADRNAWVLNVGSEQNNLRGSVVRIQADTAGLSNTHSFSDDILPFGTDDAVQVYPVGNRGDMPRAIAIDDDGYIWVGFYSGGYLAKYSYDGTSLTLEDTFRYGDGAINNIKFYEMKFAPDGGTLWISSRNSIPSKPGTAGIFSFDGANFTLENSVNPYSLLIASDDTVYATAFNDQLYIFDGNVWSQKNVGNQNRGMAFDNLGNIWIASTVGVTGGTIIYSYNVESGNPGPNYTLTYGTTPVGVGKDPFGNMWAICRTDNNNAGGYIEGFDPSNQENVGAIQVGYRPYAYGDFTLVDDSCKTVKWSFENEGTKKVFVRVKPTATLNGNPVDNITFCEDETKWKIGSDGWYYYGDNNGPTIVPAPDPNNANLNQVNVCFKYCFAADTGYDLIVQLEAQAVQSSNNAIDHEWSSHPWFNVTQ